MVSRALLLTLAMLAGGSTARAQPASVTLKNIRHEAQGLNNCAPVTALTVLGYYGTRVTQARAANALKDSASDLDVTSLELAEYLEQFGLRSMIRSAGTPELPRDLVSRGVPVVVQQRLSPGSTVAHFRTVYGYDRGRFLTSDPLRGARLWLSEAELINLWHYYNGEYLVAYPPDKEAAVYAALGDDIRKAANWERLRKIGEETTWARPGDPFAWWGLGKANLRLGNVQAAAGNFDRAVALGVPGVYFVYRQDAFEAWMQAGQYSKTLRYVQRGLQQDPGSKELRRYRDLAQAALDG